MHLQLKLSISSLRCCRHQHPRVIAHSFRSTRHHSDAPPPGLRVHGEQLRDIQTAADPHLFFDNTV